MLRTTYRLTVMTAAAALGALLAGEVASATAVSPEPAAAAAVALAPDADQTPPPSDHETPFEEAEQTSDPSESSRGGEERPESSDGETLFVHAHGLDSLMATPAFPAQVGSLPPVGEAALASQFHPDGLERPPRA